MSRSWLTFAAGFVVAIVLIAVGIPWWIPVLLILAAIAVPVVAWRMLDPSQRRRIRRMRDRGQLGG